MTDNPHVLAYDLGTGGLKTILFSGSGKFVASAMTSYDTSYPGENRHEQKPADWWDALLRSTRAVMSRAGVDAASVEACAISGQSLGVVPIDGHGNLLCQHTPIWSDSRAQAQADAFFDRTNEDAWYGRTGNGFPPPLYSIFKIMWYRDEDPDLFRKTRHILGTKDYLNYMLTGTVATDHSYASGSGVYDLLRHEYDQNLLDAAGIDRKLLAEPLASTEIIGTLTPRAADQLGLHTDVQVVAGGVDNSCMALGARNTRHGRVYNSLGSSSWIAVCSDTPIVDTATRPFVFAHVVPGLYTSAYSIFAAGTSLHWIRDTLCRDLIRKAETEETDVYDLMTAEAAGSPPGARKLLFNPNLAGGTGLDPSRTVRGAFAGLDVRHTRADMIRAGLEGISMALRVALDALQDRVELEKEMLVVGGGSTSPLWRRILADTYETTILKTSIDQDAAALGAAGLAAVGTGLWEDFQRIDDLHKTEDEVDPDPGGVGVYRALLPLYKELNRAQSRLAEKMSRLKLEEPQ